MRPAADPPESTTDLAMALAIPHEIDVSTRATASGDWVCRLEHPDLPGCVSEARNPLDALRELERLRDTWIRDRIANGQRIEMKRAPLRES